MMPQEISHQEDRRYGDILALEGRIGSHEEVCAVRYEGINKSMEKLEGTVEKIDTKIDAMGVKMEHSTKELKSQMNKYVIASLTFVIITLLSVSGYLYTELTHKTEDRFTGTEGIQLQERIERLENK